MILPIEKGDIKITSAYGNRTLNGVSSFHGGIDIVGLNSREIVSVCDGTVLWSKIVTDKNNPTWQWGNYVAVTGDDGNTIYYCHMSERKVTVGQKVKAGDVIGIVGNTGYSFGEHLHFEVRKNNIAKINAADYLNLPNAVCHISEGEYYSDEVCRVCGFTDGTRSYMGAYAFASDLWRKLAVTIACGGGRKVRGEIIASCGFLPHTVKYIDNYKFAADFWRKIGEACK